MVKLGSGELGTLLGSGVTLAFQQRAVERGHQLGTRERLRQERLDACSAYAGALVNYRRCLVHLWFCENEEPPPEDPDAVRIRAYDLRSAAQEALFRVQLLADGEAFRTFSADVLADVTALGKAVHRQDLDEVRVRTRDGVARFVEVAGRHL
ncbi:hypothetical protein ACIQU5_27240 [Streptomyces sp. NPDC090306]|uniref:hypothetical protein n=1 Tax=Streptomyces sp. NPDC090306 TaxID=3365961 RepID=UPI00380F7D43